MPSLEYAHQPWSSPREEGLRSKYAIKDVTSESEDDEVEEVEWGKRMFGVRMTPAHPLYVGRGDDKCGEKVVYSIQDIRQLLSVQLPTYRHRYCTYRLY